MYQCSVQAVVQCTKGTVIFQSERVSPSAYASTERAFHQLMRKLSSVDIQALKGKTVVTIVLSTSAVDHRVAASLAKDQDLIDVALDREAFIREEKLRNDAAANMPLEIASKDMVKEDVHDDSF